MAPLFPDNPYARILFFISSVAILLMMVVSSYLDPASNQNIHIEAKVFLPNALTLDKSTFLSKERCCPQATAGSNFS